MAALAARASRSSVTRRGHPRSLNAPPQGFISASGLVTMASRLLNAFFLIGKPSHTRHIKASRRILKQMGSQAQEPAILAYLRKINPNTYEELILSLFERDGFWVLRNRRYSGDGGLDGRVYLPGGIGWVPVQAKRYGSYIQVQHVHAFCSLMTRKKYKSGIFTHTGKTGPKSMQALGPALLLSGFDICHVIQGQLNLHDWLARALRRRSYR